MHETVLVIYCDLIFVVGYLDLKTSGFVRKFLCTFCICRRPAVVQTRLVARIVSAVESLVNMR